MPERQAVKGRGTVRAIGHRFSRQSTEARDDGRGTLDQLAHEVRVAPGTEMIEEHAKSIVSRNDSPDIPFDLSINPYRGCEQAASIASRATPTAISARHRGSTSRPASSRR